MKIRGVLFDLDGTVVEAPYDWARIKADLGVGNATILSHLGVLEGPERSLKWSVLEKYEAEATRRATLKRGMRGFLGLLAVRNIKTALVTNNSRANTEMMLGRFRLSFDLVLTRDSGFWKPSGAPLLSAMKTLSLDQAESCAVGDSPLDVRAAEEAGISRIYILSREPQKFAPFPSVEVFPGVAGLRRKILPLLF
jgi:HAD superfamily hydrolase (TIGR01509 family)